MHVLQRKVFKMGCKVYLEGRGNSDLRKICHLAYAYCSQKFAKVF
jgi:hypothetical protein